MTNKPEFVVDRMSEATFVRDDRGLVAQAVIGKVGVNTYILDDGTERKEFRPPEELSNPKSLASARLLTVTNGHPPESELPLNLDNTKRYSVGQGGDNVQFVNDEVLVTLRVVDPAALADIDEGRRQLSPGYLRVAEYNPGVYNGESYDYVQRDIDYDHVAVVDRARGGPAVRLLMDGKILGECDPMEKGKADKNATLRVKGVDYAVDAGVATAVSMALDEHQAELKAEKARCDELEAKLDAATARAEAAEAKAKEFAADSFDDRVEKAVAEKLAFRAQVVDACGAGFTCDGKTDDEIRREVVAKVWPEKLEKYDAKSEGDYRRVLFELALDALKEDDGLEQVRQSKAVNQGMAVDEDQEREAAKQRAMDNMEKMARKLPTDLLGVK